MADLNKLLSPNSVAIVGATSNFDVIRGRIVRTVLHHGFAGTVYLVSRSENEIAGHRTYPSIAALPHPVDLALMLVPAAAVCDVLEDVAKAGAGAAMIFASGFSEEGGEGEVRQQRVRDIAERYDIVVCGPNAEGFADFRTGLAATFSPVMDGLDPPIPHDMPARGRIAVIAQSGAIGFAFADTALARRAPVATVLSTGNEACVDLATYLAHGLEEGGADVYLLFIETLRRPDVFLKAAERALQLGKPIIVVKIGRSAASRRAAESHTGALAGAYEGYHAAFRKYGVIEADDIDEAVDMAVAFSRHLARLPRGRRVGIFTASGGGGGWVADACADAGLEVPLLDAGTRSQIDALLPTYGSSENPVDGTAQAVRFEGYAKFAELLVASDAVDCVVVILSARTAVTLSKEIDALAELGKTAGKPVLFWSYTQPIGRSAEIMAMARLPMMTSLRNTVRSIAEMANYAALRASATGADQGGSCGVAIDDGARVAVADALASGGRTLCEYEAREVLANYGVPFGEAILATTAAQAGAAATRLGCAVAMKVQSPEIPHKTDVGGVRLNIVGDAAARAAFEEICRAARAGAPDCGLRGVLVQPMAASGTEIILGVSRDETFGHLLMVGWGGTHVEVLKDVAFALVPLDRGEAERLLRGLKVWGVLEGHRGEPATDADALVDLIVRVSHFVHDHADIVDELDVNPVLVHPQGQGLTVVDALLVKRERSTGGRNERRLQRRR